MTASRVLEVARGELGTAETPVNRQPYGKAYGWDGVAWCMQWVWWTLTTAGCAPLVPKTASTVVARSWYMTRGQWHTSNPQPGDLVFFRFPGNNNVVNHVGIVEHVEPGGTLLTLEGNTSGTSTGDQRNGGMVARKRRLANIVGFARPDYPTPPPAAPPRRDEDPGMDIPLYVQDDLRFRAVTMAEAGGGSAVAEAAWVTVGSTWGASRYVITAIRHDGHILHQWGKPEAPWQIGNNRQAAIGLPPDTRVVTLEGSVEHADTIPAAALWTIPRR